MTLTERPERDALTSPGPLDGLLRLARRFGLTSEARVWSAARPLAEPQVYRAPPSRRWQGPSGLPWCALGDALVQTPPWFGQGVAQAARQAQLLADLPSSPGWPLEAASALNELASQQLQAAALADWAERSDEVCASLA